MEAFIVLAFIACAVLFIVGTLALIGFVLKILLWTVFFPIRIILKLVFGIIGFGLAALLLPIILVVAGIAVVGALIAAVFALLAPLLPVLLLGLVGWAIYRASSRRPSPVI